MAIFFIAADTSAYWWIREFFVYAGEMLYFLSVNYYSTELLRHLLRSVAALSFSSPYQFIIVNNSPDDTSVYALQQEFEHITIFSAMGNLGFGGGCNLGLAYAYQRDPRAQVWLINPDAVLVAGSTPVKVNK